MKRIGLIAGAAVTALTLAACTATGTVSVTPAADASHSAGASAGASTSPSPTGPVVTITPAAGTAKADPSKGITVTVSGGTLKNVSVRTSGDPVPGTYSAGNTAWHSTWALNVAQSYTVTATAAGGATVTKTSTFSTLTPSSTFSTHIIEGYQATYGVGMPIILYFSQQITDKAAVERALQIKTSKPVIGSWYWDEPCNMAPSCAYFRPRDYWPSGTTVSFTGHLDGVQGAPGV